MATLAETTADYELSLCVDCALWAANRDDSGASAEWLDLMDASPMRLFECGEFIVADQVHDFDSTECSGCDTRLAGYRFGASRR